MTNNRVAKKNMFVEKKGYKKKHIKNPVTYITKSVLKKTSNGNLRQN